jgi:signal transduction histidine kinase
MLIGEITAALNSTLGLEETFNVILVGVTAGEGLGFNRAFLFLAEDDKDEWLIGRTAIGPAGPAQAGKIWDALSEPGTGGLLDAVCTYRMALDGDDAEVNRRVRTARIPRGGPDNPFAEVIQGAHARVIRLGGNTHADVQAVFTSLDAHELACAPLRSRDRVVGLLLADHRITGEPIAPDSLRGLGLLAAQAGFAVERAALADKLEQQMVEVQQAHQKIAGIQEIVARMERFSVVGEITAEVAHQIRNPLTIIGGFARNLLSSKKPEDQEYRGLSVICKQADRVCEILERVISIDGWEGRPHQTFELEPVLWQTLAVMEIRFASRQISWSFHPELAGFTLTGRPDALRFALFEVFSGMLEHLKSGTKIIVRASNAGGGARVVICPRASDKDSVDFKQTVAGIFQGRWGTGPTQRNLALEYLSEHQAALGMEKVDGRPSLVIDFEVVKEDTE